MDAVEDVDVDVTLEQHDVAAVEDTTNLVVAQEVTIYQHRAIVLTTVAIVSTQVQYIIMI